VSVLGRVVSGSLREGVRIALSGGESIEDYPVGGLIVIRGSRYKYLAMLSNAGVSGEAAPIAQLEDLEPGLAETVIRQVKGEYSSRWVEAILIAQKSNGEIGECDTFPEYSSAIPENFHEMIGEFFDREDGVRLWGIGSPKTPRGAVVEVPIDISRLVELSFGIFGKSGTGKTFLGNILAAYIMAYDEHLASRGYVDGKPVRLLIFDMHSEYGLYLKDNLGNRIADGVGQLMREKFVVYSPSEELCRQHRDVRPLKVNYLAIEEADLRTLCRVFGVTEAFEAYLPRFRRIIQERLRLGKYWLLGLLASRELERRLLSMPGGREVLEEILSRAGVRSMEDLKERVADRISEEVGAAAATSFRTQTGKLQAMVRYPFTVRPEEDPIGSIVDSLVSRDGSSVIISMGEYEREVPLYMMIANLIARKLHERLSEVEESETKIVVFLEEAHKFLGRDVYYQSPFGVIAREMRKRGVTLCVIDQRPSELDPDVVSMLWTSFVFSLTNQRDVEAAVSGSPNPQLYARVVPRLGRRTALVFGDAIRFPVVVEVVDYARAVEKVRGAYANGPGVDDILGEARCF